MPTATVNGIRVHYEDQGSGTPLLLVHGLGTGSADWAGQIPPFSAGHRVIAPCLRGFGQTDRAPGPYSIQTFAADMNAFLDQLGIATCHLCGISMGGAVCFQLAVDQPHRLLSLTAINSQPSFELDTAKKKLMYSSRAVLARIFGLRIEARIQLRRNFPGRTNRALRNRLRGRFDNDRRIYLEALSAVAGWTVTDRLDRITAPVLFVASGLDYTSPGEKQRYAAMLPDARVVTIDGARHAVHLERPAEVNAAVGGFLETVDSDRLRQDGA